MTVTETFRDSNGDSKVLSFRFHRESRARYRVGSIEELIGDNFKLLAQFVAHFKDRQRPRIQELMDYAEGNNHTIRQAERRKDKDMSDNRAAHNFGKAISSFKQGYLVGEPIQVAYDDGSDSSDLDTKLLEFGYANAFNDLNRSLVLDMSRVGRAFEIVYRGADDVTKVRRLDPREVFVIYSNDLDERVVAGVRVYSQGTFSRDKEVVELYTDDRKVVLDFAKSEPLVAEETHVFGQVPIVEYLNTSEGLGDYESELDLIDLYDASQSDTANYMQDLADSILVIIGRVGFPKSVDTAHKQIEYLRKMKKARLLNIEPPVDANGNEGSVSANYLNKQYDVNGTEAYKKRIVNDIHKFTNTPDMTDEKFSGVQSGEAMKWKVFGLEQERVDMQALFEKSLRRRYQLLFAVEAVLGTAIKFDSAKLRFKFTPNLPKSLEEKISAFTGLNGEVSNETAMRISGIVEDPKSELDKLDSEKESGSVLSRTIEQNNRFSDVDLNPTSEVDHGEEE